jgi:hypothetical protein
MRERFQLGHSPGISLKMSRDLALSLEAATLVHLASRLVYFNVYT